MATELGNNNPRLANSITLLHLATHDSGLPRFPSNFRNANRQNPAADYSRELLFEYMASAAPPQAPGSGARYSNLGFGLLGELLAINAGTDYETLLKSKLLTPLGMSGTAIALSDEEARRVEPPHTDGLEPTPIWDINGLSGAGAVRSNIRDMVRFIKATLRQPDTTLGEAFGLAWQKHLGAEGESYSMGLGWIIARDGTTKWHDGQTGGSRTILFVNLENRSGAVVLANTNTPDVGEIGKAIQTILQGGQPPKPKPVYAVEVTEEDKQRLVGSYQIRPNFVVEIRLKIGWVIAQATNQRAFRLSPQSPSRWERKDLGAEAVFELPGSGQATSFTLIQGRQKLKAQRIK